jgi:hypothetical protein
MATVFLARGLPGNCTGVRAGWCFRGRRAGPRSVKVRGESAGGAAGAHEDERALGEGRVDEQGHAGQGKAEVDVVQQQKGRERPEDIEEEEKRPEAEEFLANSGSAEEDGAENEGADGNEDGGGDDQSHEEERGAGERREQVLDLGEVGERADVETEIHELKKQKESLHHGVGGAGEILGRGEDAVAGAGFWGGFAPGVRFRQRGGISGGSGGFKLPGGD